MEKLDITAERVIAELAKLAFFDPRSFFNADGSAKQVTELDDDTAMALAGMEVCELFEGNGEQKHAYGLSKKFKLADKLRALELLGKYLKLFTDKVEVADLTPGPPPQLIVNFGRSDKSERDEGIPMTWPLTARS